MTHHNDRSSQRSARATKAPSQSAFGLTAAMVALVAGAPAGFAQSSVDDGAPGEGLGSLMNLLGGKGDQAQPEAGAPGGDQDSFRTDGVYYDENATVELHVQDEDLTAVLQMLSIQSERNIVASKDVSARVTANLYGVTFHEALDAILHVNGYGYIERGNFIYVYPIDVLVEIEQAARQRTSRVIRLNFLNAVDAASFVSPMLSEEGEIKSNGKIGAWTDPTTPTGNEEFANESTLVVYDYPENIDAIESLLRELDTRPAQILVEATIVQTSLNEQNAFGVDFSIIGDLDFVEFLNPLGAVESLIDGGTASSPVPADGEGRAIVSNPGNTSGPATFKAGIVDEDVAVFVRLLDQVTDTTIISNPKVVTLNRQPGRVLVGRKVGYLQTTATDTATTQTVEFLDTGTQLNFRPFVTSDGVIRMELKPQVSEASLRSATDASGVAVTIPDEITNELAANVLVPDGHTIVLGGLFRESTTATRRQVPVLGDIPILGAAFRGHDDDVQRQEIIFLITPSIVSDQVLVDQGMRGEDAVRRVRAGAREGTLPFSRSRQAAQLLVEAEHLEAEGKTNQALHKVRRALRLAPAQPDAIEVRERLVNEKDVWPSGSVLNDIIQSDAERSLQHNILQHGWWGARDSLSKVSHEEPSTIASKTPSAKSRSPQQTSTASVSSMASHREARIAARAQAGSTQPQFSPEVVSEVETYDSTAVVAEEPANGEWWTTASFQEFMKTWDAEVAKEQGRSPAASEQWWTSRDFIQFLKAYEASAMADAAAGEGVSTAPITTTPTDATGTSADEFASEPEMGFDGLTTGVETGAETGVEPIVSESDRVPLYEDNPYVYYPADEVPSGFEQESFEEAVAEMNSRNGGDSDVDEYVQYLEDAESTPSYTEVDDEDPEDPRH